MKIVLAAVAAALALLGSTAQAEQTSAKSFICLNPMEIDHLTYPDDRTIMFHMSGGPVRTYRNDLPYACHDLKFQGGIAWVIRGDEICSRMQTFRVLRVGTACMLGDFTPLPNPEKKS